MNHRAPRTFTVNELCAWVKLLLLLLLNCLQRRQRRRWRRRRQRWRRGYGISSPRTFVPGEYSATHVKIFKTTLQGAFCGKTVTQNHKSNYNRLHFLIYFLHILRSISTDFSLLQEWWINSIQKCLSTPKHCYQTLCNQLTKVTKTRNIKQTLCNQLTKVTKTRNIKQIWYSHKLQSFNC